MVSAYLISFAALASTIAAHGNIISPPERLPGPAMAAVCGQAAVNSALNDDTTPLENINTSGATAACQLDLCRGNTFEDNAANVQSYSAGQTVRFLATLPIPHAGPMNVSLVDTTTNTVIGPPLISDPNYADETLAQLPANNTDFSVTMPQLQDGQCAQAGQCTMQWFWFGTRAQQTYEACVDFVMVPAGSAPAVQAVQADSTVNSGATRSRGSAFGRVGRQRL